MFGSELASAWDILFTRWTVEKTPKVFFFFLIIFHFSFHVKYHLHVHFTLE